MSRREPEAGPQACSRRKGAALNAPDMATFYYAGGEGVYGLSEARCLT